MKSMLDKFWAKALTQVFFVLTATTSALCLLATAIIANAGAYNNSGYMQNIFSDDYYVFFGTHWGIWSYANRILLPILGVCMLGLTVTLFVFALRGAGHKAGREGITRPFFAKWPLDLLLALTILLGIAVFALPVNAYRILTEEGVIVVALCALAVAAWLFLGYWICFAANVKRGRWWQNTLLYMVGRLIVRMLRWIWRGLCLIPLFWQVGLVFAGLCVADILLIALTNGGEIEAALMFFFLLRLGLLALVIWITLSLRRLQKGAKELADGKLGAPLQTQYMAGPFRTFAENLGRIRDGMQVEIEERMRSERFKTELITNVSHDIKTPLTSIVNYVDLLGKLELSDPKAKEYLAVLERQSARLKKLTEDLVEASKAATGNVPVHPTDTDVCALLQQVTCEYEERLSAGGLTLLLQLPDTPVSAKADPALLHRVFDNLLSNIAHYALAGTRVYVSAAQNENSAEISFRNISREALPATSQSELLERFVRGDAARNTQGSGLGLSIAKNLMELMNGELKLTVDGDLFKVTLVF
ncbi:MAG: HAMP domain-containing histidine kinase [Clostridiales bacterium]|nr:HAMP domain-containing histidine kinase [Clostridiales bacterium]